MLEIIHNIFNNPVIRKIFLKARYVLVIGIIVLVVMNIKANWFWPAFAFSMIGEFIQLWSFASLIKNETLTARGPYVLVRNPMYLGRFFLVFGILLLTGNLYVMIAYILFYYFYMVNRVKREEKKLRRIIGESYDKYCRRVNRFLPTVSRLGDDTVWFFDWSVLIRNNGHWNLLSVLIIYAILYIYLQ